MGKSVNKVLLIGNLGKDPEVKTIPTGTAVCKLNLATEERFKGKDGQWQSKTEWHNVVLWARLAELAGEYLKKGSKVYIEGRLQTRSWDDKQSGQRKYITEVVADEMVLLSSGGSHQASAPAEEEAPQPVAAGAAPIDDEELPF